MRSALLLAVLSLPAVSAGQDEAPKPAPGQTPVTEDEVYTTVAKLQADQGNWVGHDDVVIDHEGYVWLKAAAKVQSQRMAAFAAKGELVLVKRDAKGLAIVIGPTQQWEIVQRSTLKASDVLPCMTWTKSKPGAEQPKKLKGGLQ